MRLLKFALVICVAVCLLGCEADDPFANTYKFQNNSSYTVTVTPNGQIGWYAFTFSPGSYREVNIDSDHIYYSYSPSNKVYVQHDNGINVFLNK